MILEGLHEKNIFTEHYPFRLVINTIDEFQYPLHWHNAVELVYNTSGFCRINVTGNSFDLNSGDFLFIPPGEMHEIIASGKSGTRCFIQFSITSLDVFGGIDDIRPFMETTVRISATKNPELQNSLMKCVEELIAEYEKKEYAYALSLNARVIDIIVLIARYLAANSRSSPMQNNGKKIAGLDRINKAIDYIKKNYSHDISLKDVSDVAGFSEYHFSRLFKEYTGQNFQDYLSAYRVKQAEKLLMDSDKPILEIALESGFNSIATFNRIFKKIKGCSPTFYRKSRL